MHIGDAEQLPLLDHQTPLQIVIANENQLSCVLHIIFLTPAIAAIIIALDYNKNSSSCHNGTTYAVQLQLFLLVGGAMQLCNAICQLFGKCRHNGAKTSNESEYETENRGVALFVLAWAGVGFYMWDKQMTEECRHEQIAKMILAWSIIPYAALVLMSCFIFFVARALL
eukprot:574960_1